MVEIFIGTGPRVRVHLSVQADSLIRVSLFSAPEFSLTSDSPSPVLDKALAWLKAYGQGIDLPFSLPLPGDTFRGDVLRFLRTIPRGAVFSYQEVAKAVGNQRASRAVGNICRSNLFPLLIPCHRVIRANGELGRYTPDPSIKKELLYFEGVTGTRTGAVSCATVFSST
jgi:methylated-DNA-[protein]-cysteine S-methyltransferase